MSRLHTVATLALLLPVIYALTETYGTVIGIAIFTPLMFIFFEYLELVSESDDPDAGLSTVFTD